MPNFMVSSTVWIPGTFNPVEWKLDKHGSRFTAADTRNGWAKTVAQQNYRNSVVRITVYGFKYHSFHYVAIGSFDNLLKKNFREFFTI